MVVEDAVSIRAIARRQDWDKKPLSERTSSFLPGGESRDGIVRLLGYMLPAFQEGRSTDQPKHSDALSLRRPLLTTLRLGLIPGAFSRRHIEALIADPNRIEAALRKAAQDDTLAALIDRLDDLYLELNDVDHVKLWSAIGGFLGKQDRSWITSYQPMHEVIRAFAEVLTRTVRRKATFRDTAAEVFTELKRANEICLTSHLLRHHLFVHGLFGCRREGGNDWFMTAEQTEAASQKLSGNWKVNHLKGDLLPHLWDLIPVYTMVDMNVWDENCRNALDSMLIEDLALDGFTLMLYGSHYTTSKDTVEKMCSYNTYIQRVQDRLASPSINEAHESVRIALNKAVKGGWI
jgi:hypothetical protein